MPISESEFLTHCAEMAAVAASATERVAAIAKARRLPEDGDDIPDLTGRILGQEYGTTSADAPRGVPRHRPTQSSGRGAEELAGESDFRPGDASAEAAHRFGRELAEMRSAMKSLRRELEDILLEEPEAEPNQREWPVQDVSQADVLAGRAMQRSDVRGLMDVIGGRGKSLPLERLAKAAGDIGARIEAAALADELSLNEQIAASSILGMLPMAARDSNVAEALAERLNATDPHIRALFGV